MRPVSGEAGSEERSVLLGPFLGHLTSSSVKIWVYYKLGPSEDRVDLYVSVHLDRPSGARTRIVKLSVSSRTLFTGTVEIGDLIPNQLYYYRLWRDADCTLSVELNGLEVDDLYFTTLSTSEVSNRLDFLLLSCNGPHTYPTEEAGYALWKRIPRILSENRHKSPDPTKQEISVRFALMVGDQIYADRVEGAVLSAASDAERVDLYLDVYRALWSNLDYRKVLCRLPAFLTWDDHDITDGWGSREDSFTSVKSSEFKPEWKALFGSARASFQHMQASRNAAPINAAAGFDTAFVIGNAAFVILDLRSNRNVRIPQIMSDEQWLSVQDWVAQHRREFDTLFLVSSVVCSHGDPKLERTILRHWFKVMDFMKWIGRVPGLRHYAKQFNSALGDLRDDINDSWGADVNDQEAERLLQFLFDIQNDGKSPPAKVIILSGDIHAAGYASVYSSDERHSANAIIHHIASSPVGYKPFSWIGEAIYRRLTHAIKIGSTGKFSAHLSHHFCERNVAVISLRRYPSGEKQLKVKFYVENWPEPHKLIVDLSRSSHREQIPWDSGPLPQE